MNRIKTDRGDGRYIDPSMAVLEGEGSGQIVKVPDPHPDRKGYGVWQKLPSESFSGKKTYYNLPLLKEPVWIWAIPTYFYVGGAAGASAILGAVTQIFAHKTHKKLIARCRWVAASGTAAGVGLLIYDLGRKDRFLNMLRVFRPTSPMSMGAWILAVTGTLSSASLLYNSRNKFLRFISNAAGIKAGLMGITLAGYTGVLLNNTAVPVWQETRKTLPVLFLFSGVAGASALLQLLSIEEHEDSVVHKFSVAGGAAELLTSVLVERELEPHPHIRKTLHEGTPGLLWKMGNILSAAGLILALIPGRSKPKKAAAALLEASGALSMRFAIYKAGQASARHPESITELQRRKSGEPVDYNSGDIYRK